MDLRSFTIYDLYKRNALLYKDRIATQMEGSTITFKKLYQQVHAVVGWLTSRSIQQGDRLALLTRNRSEFFTLLGAVAAIGGMMVPVNVRLSVDEVGHILTDTQPVALFFEPEYEEMAFKLASTCPSLRELVVFGKAKDTLISFDSLLNHPPKDVTPVLDRDPVMIIPTAAIQGKPRGALLTHRNLLSCSIQTISLLQLTEHEIYMNILPLFHIAGLMAALSVMYAGGKNLMISKYDPRTTGIMIDREQVTFIGDFPPILAKLLDQQSAGECTLTSLKKVIGVDLPETINRFEALGTGQFWLVYGQTETMGFTCLSPNAERPGSAGRPGPLVDLKIVNEFDQEVELGRPGEILIRGPLVFQGYWGEKDLTEYTFREDWHHTGDLGRLDEEGFLWFVGRKAEKELIKPGGENVYPVEVEKVILTHPNIQEVSVIGVPDPKFGEGIKAICVLKPDTKLTEQELIDFVAGRIARYKKPSYVEFVSALPKREDGSIDRIRVKAMFGLGTNIQ